jgi:hypothetical protein
LIEGLSKRWKASRKINVRIRYERNSSHKRTSSEI